jgi:Retroviral aspartyl protease
MRSLSKPSLSTSTPVPIVFAYLKLESNSEPRLVRVLLDSGGSISVIKQARESKLKTIAAEQSQWTTSAGTFNTNKRATIQIILPELHETKTIAVNRHITPTLGEYNNIIGRDILQQLGIILNLNRKLLNGTTQSSP